MASRDAFVDTSALYALIDRRDSHHPAMAELVKRLLHSQWIGSLRFEATKQFYRKHADHRFSFTDCTSFVVMR
jgi:predicted nucleic acid-binding protein